MFVEELEQGFLRKRLPREKVAELMAVWLFMATYSFDRLLNQF